MKNNEKEKNKLEVLKQDRGSITVLVLVTLLFFIIFFVNLYMTSVNKITSQQKEIAKVQEVYGVSDEEMEIEYGKKQETGNTIQAGETATGGNKEYTDTVSGKTATIPEGFTVSNVDEETNINNGLVVIAPDGSEFVWVPVDNPSKMYGTDVNGKKWGKLYGFKSEGSSALNWTEVNGEISITSATGNREPDILPQFDEKTTYLSSMNTILGTNYTTADDFNTALETDFNSMIESVEKYKGFYVGRYETSLSASGVAQSKKGETSAEASQTDTYRWYGLYARQKLYKTDSVQGSMIWGTQWDSMMMWMQGNGIDVTLTSPVDVVIGKTTKNTTRVTGGANKSQTVSKDRLNNIYDLLGNSKEWTLEAKNTAFRILRGGYNSIYYNYSPIERSNDQPPNDYSEGSRLSLYLKLK